MSSRLRRAPGLHFLVIGQQKCGTTSLWRYLEDNPGLRMPPSKESPYFTEPLFPDAYAAYMRAAFQGAPRRARLGTVTPSYMAGANGLAAPAIAERIRRTVPDVRLVALLREPHERARSSHRMTRRRHGETRSYEEAVLELLAPPELERSRRDPTPTNSYVVAGEYGRILEAYLECFDREQLLVAWSSDLERAPGDVVRRVCEHIGVEPHRPARLGERFHPSGPPLVAPAAAADLLGYLEEHVWPRMRHAEQHRTAFEFWFRLWNARPRLPSEEEPADASVVARLREHYAEDTERLAAITGPVPWVQAP